DSNGGAGETGVRGSSGSSGVAGTFTVFAPTDDALAKLEEERPWLFSSNTTSTSTSSTGDGNGDGDGEGGMGGWSPVRELLAYHLVPGQRIFS
ncbi:unnamed protein product, partial [Discosporangium mesarthrocarpum]